MLMRNFSIKMSLVCSCQLSGSGPNPTCLYERNISAPNGGRITCNVDEHMEGLGAELLGRRRHSRFIGKIDLQDLADYLLELWKGQRCRI